MKDIQKLILVAHDIGGVGGMERHLEEMISRLKEHYALTVVASTMRLQDSTGVRFVRVWAPKRPFLIRNILFACYGTLRLSLLRSESIVHTTGAIVWNRADVSTIHFCHKGYRQTVSTGRDRNKLWHRRMVAELSLWMKLSMEYLCYRQSVTQRLVAVSSGIERELTTHYGKRGCSTYVISNGVDVERFHPITPYEKRALRARHGLGAEGKYILFMGGDWDRKGLDYLLEAFNLIAHDHPDVSVLVVGKGDVLRFQRLIDPNLQHRVHFVGRQPNPEFWYQMSDIFVFPSHYEACSLAVLEAASSGLAMLVTKVGGAEDVVTHGVSGVFIEQNQQDIAHKLSRLLRAESDIEEYGRAARKRVETMTWDHTFKEFQKVYRDVSNQRKWN